MNAINDGTVYKAVDLLKHIKNFLVLQDASFASEIAYLSKDISDCDIRYESLDRKRRVTHLLSQTLATVGIMGIGFALTFFVTDFSSIIPLISTTAISSGVLVGAGLSASISKEHKTEQDWLIDKKIDAESSKDQKAKEKKHAQGLVTQIDSYMKKSNYSFMENSALQTPLQDTESNLFANLIDMNVPIGVIMIAVYQEQLQDLHDMATDTNSDNLNKYIRDCQSLITEDLAVVSRSSYLKIREELFGDVLTAISTGNQLEINRAEGHFASHISTAPVISARLLVDDNDVLEPVVNSRTSR